MFEGDVPREVREPFRRVGFVDTCERECVFRQAGRLKSDKSGAHDDVEAVLSSFTLAIAVLGGMPARVSNGSSVGLSLRVARAGRQSGGSGVVKLNGRPSSPPSNPGSNRRLCRPDYW